MYEIRQVIVHMPIESQLKALTDELHHQWLSSKSELRQGKLKYLEYDIKSKTLAWHRPKTNTDKVQQDRFYDQMSFCDVADVFRFVNKQCHFLAALTPLQPRYAKHVADQDSLMAVIFTQAMKTTYQQYLRLASLQGANDQISTAIA